MTEKLETAVMLVGGNGSRLSSVTGDTLKPLVEVNGKSILNWSIDWLKSNGIKNIVFATADKRKKIQEYMDSKDNFGLNVNYSETPYEAGTGGAFKKAIDEFVQDNDFVAMNGDELTNLDLHEMAKQHYSHKTAITMALSPLYCPFSVAELDKENNSNFGKLTRFKYGLYAHDLPISIGIYIFNSKIKDAIPDKGSIEEVTFTDLATRGEILGYLLRYGEEWTTVNNPKDIKIAENKLRVWSKI
jgi:NDP-sugar pyrophosphorylase family protein